MESLNQALKAFSRSFEGNDTARIALRTARVHAMFKQVMECEYGEYSQVVLDHVNAVYIKRENEENQLIVYMDDSMYRSDLHTRQVIVMHRFSSLFGETIDSFKALPSRFDMKKRHPFKEERDEAFVAGEGGEKERIQNRILSEEEVKQVEEEVEVVENPMVRKALKTAIIASMKTNSAINDENDVF